MKMGEKTKKNLSESILMMAMNINPARPNPMIAILNRRIEYELTILSILISL